MFKPFLPIIKLIKKAKSLLLTNEEGIYYINGPETLPPPLNTEEETECINALQYNDQKAKNTVPADEKGSAVASFIRSCDGYQLDFAV